jgi:hypothetical protein
MGNLAIHLAKGQAQPESHSASGLIRTVSLDKKKPTSQTEQQSAIYLRPHTCILVDPC